MDTLRGKTALVVGGTSGIGSWIAEALVREGVSVTVQGRRHPQRLSALCRHGIVHTLLCNLQKSSCVKQLCVHAASSDILCIAYGPFLQKPLDATTAEDWEETVYANLTLPGILVSAALPAMKERQWGRILLFGGTETQILRGFKTNAVYGAAKTGLMSLVRSISMVYAAYGITANAICPGFTDTGLLPEETRRAWAQKNPDSTLVTPEVIAEAALFLLKKSEYNGVLMPIDKGWSSYNGASDLTGP